MSILLREVRLLGGVNEEMSVIKLSIWLEMTSNRDNTDDKNTDFLL